MLARVNTLKNILKVGMVVKRGNSVGDSGCANLNNDNWHKITEISGNYFFIDGCSHSFGGNWLIRYKMPKVWATKTSVIKSTPVTPKIALLLISAIEAMYETTKLDSLKRYLRTVQLDDKEKLIISEYALHLNNEIQGMLNNLEEQLGGKK